MLHPRIIITDGSIEDRRSFFGAQHRRTRSKARQIPGLEDKPHGAQTGTAFRVLWLNVFSSSYKMRQRFDSVLERKMLLFFFLK